MAAAPQQQSNSDNGLAPLWIMALLVIVVLLLWYFARGYIVSFIFKVKIFEATLVSWFSSSLDTAISYMRDALVTPDTVSPDELYQLANIVGEVIRWPVIAVLAVLAFILIKTDARSRFKKAHSMKTLAEQEVANWPQIAPVVKLDLVAVPLDEGGWAMALAPLPFCKKYNILRFEKNLEDSSKPKSIRGDGISLAVHRGEAKRIFTLQLGDYWEGVATLNTHTKALLAMFAAKLNRDRKGYTELMKRINRSTLTGKLDFTGSNELLKKHLNSKPVQRIISSHAYTLTVMASMLQQARSDGVLPTSDFLWLKPLDRRLWYVLNSVGRQTPFCEVAGPFAHWLAERLLGRKSLVPMVDEAVSALEIAVKDIKYIAQRDGPED